MNEEKIIAEAKERFQQAKTREASARNNWRSDMEFGYGDNVNMNQWQGANVDARTTAGKPCMTMNRTKPYCLSIINSAMQDKADISVRPVSGAGFDAADVMECLIRHIEFISDSTQAYQKAIHDQVFGGLGYIRVKTEYSDDGDSFDQEIKVVRVQNALSVYLDPHIQTMSGEDAEWGIVFTDTDRKDFEKNYKRYKDIVSTMPLGNNEHDVDEWETPRRVRLAEYYRKVRKDDVLHYMPDGQIVKESEAKEVEMPEGATESFLDGVRRLSVNSREVETTEVEWYQIAGSKILEHTTIPTKYIPIIRVVGLEIELNGILDRIGHVRSLRDAQKSLNYFVSAGIEFTALQSKSPWKAAAAAIEGFEDDWRNANLQNFAVLTYNHLDDAGNELQPPERTDPPVYASAFLDGMKVSIEELELLSGQPAATMQNQTNERSGKAIQEREKNAANAVFHFTDNFATALRYLGRIIVDMAPHIYDTARVIKVLSLDNTPKTIQVNPSAPQAYQPVQALDGESLDPQHVAAIWNPSIGKYDVVVTTGPQYDTRREQFVDAGMDILRENPEMAPIIGDLIFGNMDFAGAKTIAERLRRGVPPQYLGTVDPQVTELQKQLAIQAQTIQAMNMELMKAKAKDEIGDMQKQIDWYEAETKRLAAISKIDPEALKPIIREQASQVVQESINDLMRAHALDDAMRAQIGAPQQPPGQQPNGMQPQQPPPGQQPPTGTP